MAANSLERHAKNAAGEQKESMEKEVERLRAVAEEIRKTNGPMQGKAVAKQNESSIAAFLDSSWWAVRKLSVMRTGLWLRFTDKRVTKERDALMSSGVRYILEFSNADKFWAVMPGGEGENWLGRLLMDIREELQSDYKPTDNEGTCESVKGKYSRGVLDLPLTGSTQAGEQKSKRKRADCNPKTLQVTAEYQGSGSNEGLGGAGGDETLDDDVQMDDAPGEDLQDASLDPHNLNAVESGSADDDANDDEEPRVPKLKPWQVQRDPELVALEAELRAKGVFDEDDPVMRIYSDTFDGPIKYTS